MTNRFASVENLIALCDYLTSGLTPPLELEEWHLQVLERWRSGQSLSQAFNILDNQAERRYRRNIELRNYAAMLPGSTWQKAEIIAKEVIKLTQPISNISEIVRAIDQIAKTPESPKQIARIIKMDKRPGSMFQ